MGVTGTPVSASFFSVGDQGVGPPSIQKKTLMLGEGGFQKSAAGGSDFAHLSGVKAGAAGCGRRHLVCREAAREPVFRRSRDSAFDVANQTSALIIWCPPSEGVLLFGHGFVSFRIESVPLVVARVFRRGVRALPAR